jgi:UDP-N-acetylmuramyl tripeptide synthase
MFGRGELVVTGASELQIMLMKNPAGANEIVRTIALDPGEHHVLALLNDRDADGRDVSWIWDADFEDFAASIAQLTCTGARGAELALRFKYAGVPTERITLESDLARAVDAAIERANGSIVYALPTYTAMLELREVLRKRGQATSSWVRA